MALLMCQVRGCWLLVGRAASGGRGTREMRAQGVIFKTIVLNLNVNQFGSKFGK